MRRCENNLIMEFKERGKTKTRIEFIWLWIENNVCTAKGNEQLHTKK
jgi:hypothetical protein